MEKPLERVEVVLLTQAHCTFCEQAEEVLSRLASDYPISLAAVDLSSREGQALADRGGVLFPPGIFINGDAFSYGRPSERRLRRELERRLEISGKKQIDDLRMKRTMTR